MTNILNVVGLGLWTGGRNPAQILADVDLSMEVGQRCGIIGFSGAGKSMLLRCLTASQPSGSRVDGQITIDGVRLDGIKASRRRRVVADHVAVLRQDSMGSLNPYQRIDTQLRRALRHSRHGSHDELDGSAARWLGRVGLSDVERILRSYPHQLSGGMRQRVSMALSLCGDQPLILADEPTTALDMPHQKECIDLIDRLTSENGRGLLFVSHDLALVWRLCRCVVVMDAGRIVEAGPVEQVFRCPAAEVTRELLTRTRKVRPACLS